MSQTIDADINPVLREIGRLVFNFNSAEQSLRRITFLLIDENDERKGEIILDRMSPSILEDLIRALITHRLHHSPLVADQAASAICRFSDVRTQRNNIVHALWVIPNNSISPDDIEAVRLQPRKGSIKYVSSISPENIKATATAASQVLEELEELHRKIQTELLSYKQSL